MTSLTEVQQLHGHTDRVWSVAWSPDGNCLASCSGDKTIRLWQRQQESADSEAACWACSAILEHTHTKTIRSVAWSPGGLSLATASFDGTTVIWRQSNGAWEQVAILEGHENEVKCAAYAPSGSLLATCGRDKSVWIWESFPGDDFECVDVKQGHSQDVKMVAWHPTDALLASASYDDTIKLWVEDADGSDWYCAQTLEGPGLGHQSTVWGLAFNGSGTRMASCSADRTLKVWGCGRREGLPFFRLTCTVSGQHDRPIYSVHWSADGRHIASACGDNALRIFDHAEGADGCDTCTPAAKRESAHDQDLNCVRWHPSDPELLATCGDDGTIKLWRYRRAGGARDAD